MDILSPLPDVLLLHTMCKLHIQTLRGRLALVSKRMSRLAMSSAALNHHADVAFLGAGATSGITVVLDALARINADGTISSLRLGNHQWGKGTTKKLLKLFTHLERLDLSTSKKVAQFALTDFALPAAPRLRAFTWGWGYGMNEKAVLNLIQGRSEFELLDLRNLEGMGDTVLGGECGVTDATLHALASTCSRLKTLRLSGSLRVTNAGLKALADGCGELEEVTLVVSTIFNHGERGLLYGGVTAVAASHFGPQVSLTLSNFPLAPVLFSARGCVETTL